MWSRIHFNKANTEEGTIANAMAGKDVTKFRVKCPEKAPRFSRVFLCDEVEERNVGGFAPGVLEHCRSQTAQFSALSSSVRF